MFIILNESEKSDIQYLAWQYPAWDEDGYFWTRRETVLQMIDESANIHRFLFKSEKDAQNLITNLNLKAHCKVTAFEI